MRECHPPRLTAGGAKIARFIASDLRSPGMGGPRASAMSGHAALVELLVAAGADLKSMDTCGTMRKL
jgi:hypothetical protein